MKENVRKQTHHTAKSKIAENPGVLSFRDIFASKTLFLNKNSLATDFQTKRNVLSLVFLFCIFTQGFSFTVALFFAMLMKNTFFIKKHCVFAFITQGFS